MGYTWKWAGTGAAIGALFSSTWNAGKQKTKRQRRDAVIQSALVFGSVGGLLGFMREKSDAAKKREEFDEEFGLGSPELQPALNPIAEKGIVAGIAGLTGLSGIVVGGLAGFVATAAYQSLTGKKVKRDTPVHAALGGAALFGLGIPAYIVGSYAMMDEAPGERLL